MPKAKGKNYESLTKQEKDKIVELFKKGLFIKDIKKIIPVTVRTMPKLLKEYGINSSRKNRYELDEDYFNNIDSEHKAYWLGFIAADGCITKTNYFAISLIDKEILEKLKKDLKYTGDIYEPKTKHNTPMYRINFSSKKICDALRKHGIHESKSLTYNKLPKLKKKLMHHFIRGYFDGDGSVSSYDSTTYWNNKEYVYSQLRASIIATDEFCEELKKLFTKEINYTPRKSNSKCKKMKYINFYKKEAIQKLFDYLYKDSTIYLKRKYNKWKMGDSTEESVPNKKVN